MCLALGMTLGQLGMADGQWGLVFSNKWRREGPVLSCPAQPKVPADAASKGRRVLWLQCQSALQAPRLSSPRASRWKKTVHHLDRMLVVPFLT